MGKKRKISTLSDLKSATEYTSTIFLLNNNIKKFKQILSRKRFQSDSLAEKANYTSLVQNLEKLQKLKEELKTKATNQEILQINGNAKIVLEEFSETLQTKVAKTYVMNNMEQNRDLLENIKLQIKEREKDSRIKE